MVLPGTLVHPATPQTNTARSSQAPLVNTATRNQQGALRDGTSRSDLVLPKLPLSFWGGQTPLLFQTKSGADVSSASAAPFVLSPSSTVINFTGFQGLNENDTVFPCQPAMPCNPPDAQIAVGPSHIIAMVNMRGELFTALGFPLKNFTLSSFFNTGSDFISDPKVMYDASSGRWFASIIDLTGYIPKSGTFSAGNVKVAVSLSSDPTLTNSTTGGWNTYVLKFGTNVPDQPIIGVNDDKVVVNANRFVSLINPSYVGDQFYVLNKNDLVRGGTFVHNSTFGVFPSLESIHPVESLSSTSTEFMVSTGAAPATSGPVVQVQLFSVTGVPGVSTVTVSNVTLSISALAVAPMAIAAPGYKLDTGDNRVLDAAWFQGKIWYAADDACTPPGDNQTRSCIRLTQVDTTTVSIKQDFDFSALGQYYFYPALRIDGQGNLDVICGFSSATINPSLALTGQAVGDSSNSLASPLTIKSGSGADTRFRYGDYFGAAVDPSDTGLVWVAGEYESLTFTGWSTWIANMRVKPVYLSATPAALAFVPGSIGTSTIAVNGINGFTGTIGITTAVAPVGAGGVTASLNPSSVAVASGGSATSTLTITTISSTPNGLYNVTVTGTSGSRSHSVLVSIAVTPITTSISGISNFTGVTVKTTGTISIDSPATIFSFSGTVTVTATNATTGAAIFMDTYAVTRIRVQSTSAGGYVGVFLANVAVNPYALASGVTVTLSWPSSTTPGVLSTSTSVSRNPDIDADGIVNQVDANVMFRSLNCSIGQSCYNPRSDLNADGTVNTLDFNILDAALGGRNLINDFTISTTPNSVNIPVGSSGGTTVTLASISGFAGPVNLAASPSSVSLTATCTPTTVSLGASGTATSTCTISSSTGGLYTISITGSDGSISHSAIVSVGIEDFQITANPTSLTLQQDSSNSSTIRLQSLGNFPTANATLSFTITHLVTKGSSGTVTVTLSRTSFTLPTNGSAGALLTVTAPNNTNPGLYTITITATVGPLTHTVTVNATVSK